MNHVYGNSSLPIRDEMWFAYEDSMENTSYFEGKMIAPLAVDLLISFFGKSIYNVAGKWAIAGALCAVASNNIPADLNFSKCRWNPKLTGIACNVFFFNGLLDIISMTGGERFKKYLSTHSYAMNQLKGTISICLISHVVKFEGDSVFSKTYRVAKACMASLIAGCTKQTIFGGNSSNAPLNDDEYEDFDERAPAHHQRSFV